MRSSTQPPGRRPPAARLLLPLGALLLLAGCATDTDSREDGEPVAVREMRHALPRAEAMTIDLPSGPFQVREQAMYYAFTWQVTTGVNRFVRDISGVLEDITRHPPTDTDGHTFATWGPWTEPLSPATWRVHVARDGDGYRYTVDAWPRLEGPDAARVVLSGHHTPRRAPDAPRDGHGTWTYDLSAARQLDPIAHEALGQVHVEYALAETRTLAVTFTDVEGPHQPQATSTLYRYTQAPDRAGTLDFISNLDIHQDDPRPLDRREVLRVRARWQPEGPGRADALATHGDLPAGTAVEVTECWGDAFTRTYLHLSYAEWVNEEGDAARCPYPDRQTPEFEGFDPDRFADDALIEALPQLEDFDLDIPAVAEPVAEPAAYYQLQRAIIEGLREQVGGALGIITQTTRHPPTGCDDDGCAWGPWTDWDTRLSFLVTARRAADDRDLIEYHVQLKRFGDEHPWSTLLLGTYRAEADGGHGTLDLDYDTLSALTGQAITGRFLVGYTREGPTRSVDATYEQVSNDGAEPVDARYVVTHGPQGGHLDLALPLDLDNGAGGRDATEDLTARIRWTPEQRGVANGIATGGDLPHDRELLTVECWDQNAARTHLDTHLRRAGTETLPELDHPECAYSDWRSVEFFAP